MIDTKYTYAVARIRALETALFTSATLDQLMACQTEEQCLQLIQEKGWGGADTPVNAEAILTREQEKIWENIRDLGVDMSVFDVLSYPNMFHNLKAAIKDVCTEENGKSMNIYYDDTAISPDEMLEIVRSRIFLDFPNIWLALQKRLMRHCFTQGTDSSATSLWTRQPLRRSMQQARKQRTALSRIMRSLPLP